MSFSILAISGSLRAGSVNTEVLRAIQQLATEEFIITQYAGLADLPHFNPDDETMEPVQSVAGWRELLQRANAVLICSPEYAHGVPGVLKNALDWVVGSGEFMYKPVSLINASSTSQFITPQLTETLTVMMANVVPDACVTLSLAGKKRDAVSMCNDGKVAAEIRCALDALARVMISDTQPLSDR